MCEGSLCMCMRELCVRVWVSESLTVRELCVSVYEGAVCLRESESECLCVLCVERENQRCMFVRQSCMCVRQLCVCVSQPSRARLLPPSPVPGSALLCPLRKAR